MDTNETPIIEELTGQDANPPLTNQELKELADILDRTEQSGTISDQDKTKAHELSDKIKRL